MKTLNVIPSAARKQGSMPTASLRVRLTIASSANLQLAGLFLVLAASLSAQDTARIAPVVISATRTEMSRSALPVAVTVITAAELQLRGIATVAEALRDVTSAYVAQSGSQGSQTSLFLRGGESKYVKVLVDGVPANDPGGFYDFSSLTTDNVERIEIVRGPVSVIHGADAVTGVVHVITKSGRGQASSSVDVRAGMAPRTKIGSTAPERMSAFDVSADVSGALASSSYSLGIARHQTDGLYELNNHHHNNVLSGRLQFQPMADTDLRLSLRYSDSRHNYPTNGGGTVGDSNSNRSEDRILLGVELTRRLTTTTRAALTLNSSLNDGVSDNPMDTPTGSSSLIQDKTRRRGAELRVAFVPNAIVSGTVGAQMEQQDHRQTLQSQSSFGPFMSNFKAARRNTGAYGELVLQLAERFGATFGGRVDDNEAFGTFGTYRTGLSLYVTRRTRLRFTVGNAFREPTFLENYSSGFSRGNPDLTPERTSSMDGGIDQQLLDGRVDLSVTGFSQRFSNMIDYDPTDSCGFSYCNVAEATSRGLELEANGRLSGPFWASVGATLLKTEVIDPGFDQSEGGLYRAGESLIRRPGQKVRGELSYRGGGPLRGSLSATRIGDRDDKDFRFPFKAVVLPAYTRVDLGGEYEIPLARTQRTAVTLRVENLTDEKYENVFNFLAPRRTVALGVRSTF
jgi:vitamin B12 transporter